MRSIRLMVWTAVALAVVFANDEEKDMEPVTWMGGETLDPRTGQVHFNGLATRCQIHEHWAFLAIPKLKPDVQSSCAKLDMRKQIGVQTKHTLTPFPPDEPTDPLSCKKLQSAVDLCIDHLSLVWILDVGAIHPPKNKDERTPHICPPKIVALEADTGKLRHEINLLPFVSAMTRLQFLACDYDHKGNPFVYVSDAGTKALIVYDVMKNECRRVDLPEDVINNFSPRDVLYIALIRKANGRNKLYFTYRSGESLWCINTEDLQKGKSASDAWEVGKKEHKMILLGTDDWDCLYYKYDNTPKKVFKWNTETDFHEKNFHLVHNSQTELTPTHAIADYKNGVMRLCTGNLIDYLKHDTPCKNAINSLDVMAIGDDTSSSPPLGHQGMMREL